MLGKLLIMTASFFPGFAALKITANKFAWVFSFLLCVFFGTVVFFLIDTASETTLLFRDINLQDSVFKYQYLKLVLIPSFVSIGCVIAFRFYSRMKLSTTSEKLSTLIKERLSLDHISHSTPQGPDAKSSENNEEFYFPGNLIENYQEVDRILRDFPKAAMAIEYRRDLKDAYLEICQYDHDTQMIFVKSISENPRIDVKLLMESIKGRFEKIARPFGDKELDDAHEFLFKKSRKASDELLKIVWTLGPDIDIGFVIDQIKKKYNI